MTKTGCLIDAVPLFSEKMDYVMDAISKTLGVRSKQVKFLKTDKPQAFDTKYAREKLRMLKAVLADPLHR
eukprot:7050262-Karenia_brevis.AAC.1